LTEREVKTILDCLQALLVQVNSGKLEPSTVLNKEGELVDVTPIKLERYGSNEYRFKTYATFNEALDEFYTYTKAAETTSYDAQIKALTNEAENLKRIIAEQEETIQETEAQVEKERQKGDLIYAHVAELQTLIERFLKNRQADNQWETITAAVKAEKREGVTSSSFFESFDPNGQIINVKVDNLPFSLSLRRTLYETAAEYYESGKRAKQKQTGAKNALEKIHAKLAETQAKLQKAQECISTKPSEALVQLSERKIKRKEWYEKFRWFTSSDGFLIVAGKDAASNEVLIKKYTEENDVVFHAEIVGAPFTVIKTHSQTPSEQCLHEAAEFAAAYSRGWREGFGTVDVYWVKPSQLSKSGPSGESVAHGAFMVLGERNWLRNTPLKLAIGLIVEPDGKLSFMGGPTRAVEAKANVQVTITPGDLEGKELLKRILKTLASNLSKENREQVLKASVEKIREFVPYGKGRIIEN
jgi:predicted ribosome quality control (RQC) complex YloA/Tae2 family protein